MNIIRCSHHPSLWVTSSGGSGTSITKTWLRIFAYLGSPSDQDVTHRTSPNSSTFLALGILCLLSLCVPFPLLKGTHSPSFPSNIPQGLTLKTRARKGSLDCGQENDLDCLWTGWKTQVRTRPSYLPPESTECNIIYFLFLKLTFCFIKAIRVHNSMKNSTSLYLYSSSLQGNNLQQFLTEFFSL